jgi:hypothetical protein
VTSLFPPLPIWMALLYHRETSVHSGADLAARIADWQRQSAALNTSGDLRMSDFPHTIVQLPIQHVHKEAPQ